MSRETLIKLLEPTIERVGYELTDLELKLGGRDGRLRLFIDKDDGIDIEECAAVSRQVRSILDVGARLPGP